MRLSDFEMGIDIHFEENKVDILVIENQELYTSFLQKLLEKNNADSVGIILSENDKAMPLNKCVCVVHSPVLLELNNKRMLSFLYQELKEIAEEEVGNEKEEINAQIISYLDKLLVKVPYPIKCNLELDIVALFKQYEVQLDTGHLTFLEKLIYYMQLEKALCGTRLMIFVNLKAYLNEVELEEVYKMAFYNKIQLLLLESVKKDVLPAEKYCIIDKDKCVIYH